MKKLLFLFLFIFTGLIFAIEPETPPGAGTESSPYQLSKYEHLLWIGELDSEEYIYATLTADIDASSSLDNYDAYYYYFYFYGSLDGQGHTISDLCRGYIDIEYYDDYVYTNCYRRSFFSDFCGDCRNLNLVGNDYSYSCRFIDEYWGYAEDDEEGKTFSVENIKVSNGWFAEYFEGYTAKTIEVSNGGWFAYDYFEGTAKDVQVTTEGIFADEFEGTAENIKVTDYSDFAWEFYGTAKDVQLTESYFAEDYFSGTAENVKVTDGSLFSDEFYGTASAIEVSGVHIYEEDDDYEPSCFAYEFCGTAENVKVTDGGKFAGDVSSATVENIEINNGLFASGVYRSYVNNAAVHNAPCFISDASNTVLERISVDGSIDLDDEFYSEWVDVGGCIGYAYHCIVRNVAVNVNITGSGTNTNFDSVGGIIGWDDEGESRIINSYSAGKISGVARYVGGIVGYPGYNEGISVENCYFDSSIAPTNGFGTGVSAEELKKQATFENWDFNDVWTIDEGQSYPTLRSSASQNEKVFCKGLSKAAVSIKGTLSDDDLKAIQDNGNEVCLFSNGSGVEITSRYALEEAKSQKFSYKSKEPAVSINYAGKSKSFKFASASPLITLGKKSGEGFSACALSDTKNKLSSSIKITKDVSEYLKEKAEVSLYHSELSDKVLDGTTMQLSAKGKSLAGKTTENGVKVSVKINLGKKTAQIKYTGMDVILPVIVKSAE